MYIARLLLKGFKSFGGTHDLPLSPGMSAIVGPNGSGKSNLLDALRWVLGDSHASKLRIGRQSDLLFQGSVSRSKASEAEVSIQLREGTRVCAIKRKVTDAGAATQVDGVRMTLAELEEAKREWQLGGDRFAFIGQGDVTEVIQQRPSARRVLLESLFGIDAYRKRRTEATDRLVEANAEYERLRTFSAELAARREEIAPLVERASQAREILNALEDNRKLLYWVRRLRNERSAEAEEASRRKLHELLAGRELWKSLWERSLIFLEGNLSELSQTRQNQMRELEDAKNTLTNFTKTAYGYGSALTSAAKRLAQATEEKNTLVEKIEKLKRERDSAAKESSSLTANLNDLNAKLKEAEEKYLRQQDAIKEEKEARERSNRERGEVEGSITALLGRMRSVGLALRELQEKPKGDLEKEILSDIKKELDVLEKKHAKLLDEQYDAASRHMDVYTRLQEVTSELQKNRRESTKINGRLSELQETAQSEVYPKPVQHLLSAARLGKLDAKPVAALDAFDCPEELATAMEGFLGARQFWILVDTMDEVGRCIDRLKQGQMGRATFLSLDRAKPRRIDRTYRLPSSGIVGWALELIKVKKKWLPAIEHMLGDLLIVEDYATGKKLVQDGYRGPVATLDGDVFQPAGTISGGRAPKTGKALEIKSSLSKMESDAKAMTQLVEKLSEEFTRLETEESQFAADKERVSAAIRELAGDRSALDAKREEIMRERARAKSESESMKNSIREWAQEYAALLAKKRAMEEMRPESGEDTDTKLLREIEKLKGKSAVLAEKVHSGFVLSERVRAELRTAERELEELEAEISSLDLDVIKNRDNLTRLAFRYAEVADRRRVVMGETAEFAERYESISRRKERRTARLDRAKEKLTEAQDNVNSCDMRTAELARERLELLQTWEEQYPYPGAEAFAEADPQELRRNIRDMDNRLKLLGDVDMGSLSEDRNLRDRLAYLGTQLDDVGSSMRELNRLISEADEQARTIFTNALVEIDERFNALFKQLFGGGDARLDFIEGDSLWESGVDVVARPPGKHPQSIAQLSGGEQSLSAIALLFASLEVAQCPIAVLDEVDAALDEVNLRRFADLTKEASKVRQILVMTHRRVTMERADVLFGVTLAEPGLSQVVGVRIEDWG